MLSSSVSCILFNSFLKITRTPTSQLVWNRQESCLKEEKKVRQNNHKNDSTPLVSKRSAQGFKSINWNFKKVNSYFARSTRSSFKNACTIRAILQTRAMRDVKVFNWDLETQPTKKGGGGVEVQLICKLLGISWNADESHVCVLGTCLCNDDGSVTQTVRWRKGCMARNMTMQYALQTITAATAVTLWGGVVWKLFCRGGGSGVFQQQQRRHVVVWKKLTIPRNQIGATYEGWNHSSENEIKSVTKSCFLGSVWCRCKKPENKWRSLLHGSRWTQP